MKRACIAMLAAAAGLSGAARGEVIITEIMFNPAGQEAPTEWIEVYNTGTEPVDIGGWTFQDEDGNSPSQAFPAGLLIQPGEAIVFGNAVLTDPADPSSATTTVADFRAAWGTGFMVVMLENNITLANTANRRNEILGLYDDSNNLVDLVNYEVGDQFNDWPFNTNGVSFQLDPNFLNSTDNDRGAAWRLSVVGVDGGYSANEVLDANGNVLFSGDDTGSPGFVETDLVASFEDLNGNGVDDAMDIFNGTSNDCNRNRIPDEVEPDCDNNGVPDVCEIGFNPTNDCNQNGIPDACEIALDPTLDLNGNGIIDACESGQVIITEIMYDPRSSPEQEWIEIYNAGTEPVDLRGWIIEDLEGPGVVGGGDGRSGPIQDPADPSAPVLMQPGEVIVLCASTVEDFKTAWGQNIRVYQLDPFGSRANNASATNEILALQSPDPADPENYLLVDVANYHGRTSNGNSSAGWPANTNRHSIYLKGDSLNSFLNDFGTNWRLSWEGLDGSREVNISGPYNNGDVGSPGFVNVGVVEQPTHDVIITEIMYTTNATVETPDGNIGQHDEWVEIYNNTDNPIDISGWYLMDEDGRTEGFAAGTVLAPREVAVIIPDENPIYIGDGVRAFQEAWGCGYQIIPVKGWSETVDGNTPNPSPSNLVGLANGPSEGNETLRLYRADGVPSDIANYDDDGEIWPFDSTGSALVPAWSIYVLPGFYDGFENDNGLNWAASFIGFDRGRLNELTAIYNADMFGSPGELAGVQEISDFTCPDICAPDINGDGVVDADDFFAFLGFFAAGNPIADFNNDGVIDADDFFAFLTAFAEGC